MNKTIKFILGICLLLFLILFSLSFAETKTYENDFLQIEPTGYEMSDEQRIYFDLE